MIAPGNKRRREAVIREAKPLEEKRRGYIRETKLHKKRRDNRAIAPSVSWNFILKVTLSHLSYQPL